MNARIGSHSVEVDEGRLSQEAVRGILARNQFPMLDELSTQYRCPHCIGGCLVMQYDETWCLRCLNCGWYHNPPSEIPAREPFWRVEKCQNCRRKPLSGKKYCGRCHDYMIRYRAKKKARRA
jgi:hypothetical protein